MKTINLSLNERTTINFEESEKMKEIKINKIILLFNDFDLKEKARIKTGGSQRQDIEPGFYSFEEIQKRFEKLESTLRWSYTKKLRFFPF